MGVYTYKALDRESGQILEDQVEGANTTAVAITLRQQGLFVINVKEQSTLTQKDILAPFKKVRLRDLVIFSRQFATLINAGLPIVRALYILSEHTDNKMLKRLV